MAAQKSIWYFVFFLNICATLPNWTLESKADDVNLGTNPFEFGDKQAYPIRSGPCNIPVEHEFISQADFLSRYAYRSPVVFRRSKPIEEYERNRVFREKNDLENLVKEFGDKVVTIGTANTYSYKRSSIRLKDYIEKYVRVNQHSEASQEFDEAEDESSLEAKLKYGNETWYFFGENNMTEWKSLFDLYERPPYDLPNHDYAYSYGIASTYTGVPFHFHGPGFAETVWGRKRWFLYEPNSRPDFDPDKSTLHWFLEDYGRLKAHKKPLECILEPFDIIYFPDRWWHATLNLDPTTIFMSTFLSPVHF